MKKKENLMDFNQAVEILELSQKQIELSQEYQKNCQKAGQAKLQLELILTGEKLLSKYRQTRKNLGLEMAILMMIEEKGEDTRQIFKEYHEAESKAEGLKQLLNAYNSKIIAYESLMKYQLKGESNA